jgi:Heterokaryon incompatibility protein (HET)
MCETLLLRNDGDGEDGDWKELKITKQLALALSYLQQSKPPLVLWVDQISVNQQDLEERASQVQLMKQIYEGAQKSIVWLGRPADDNDLAILQELCGVIDKATLPTDEIERRPPEDLKTMPAMADPAPHHRRKAIQRKADTEAMRPYIEVRKDNVKSGGTRRRQAVIQRKADTEAMRPNIEVRKDNVKSGGTRRRQAVINLFNQPRFARAWVVQEVLLSRAVEIMYGLQLPLRFLERVSSSVADIENQTLGWRYILFNVTSGYDAFQIITGAQDELESTGRVDSYFLNFMWAMQRSTQSSDPRDKVFAFMGLKPPESPPFVTPSYIRSVADMYVDAVRS